MACFSCAQKNQNLVLADWEYQARALRNLFTGTSFKLQDTIQRSKTEYEALRNLDDTIFKEAMREPFRDSSKVRKVIKDLSHSFDSKFDHLQAEVMRLNEQLDETKVVQEIKRNHEWFRSGQIAGEHTPRDRHGDNLKERHPNSCEWIFGEDVTAYQTWIGVASGKMAKRRQGKPSHLRMLWLHGDGGVGKSMLVSTIISELQKKKKHLMVYFFCKLGDEWSQNGSQIMLHLCAQLFRKGSEHSLDIQREFNEVMNEVREELSDAGKEDTSNISITTTQSLFRRLANTLPKDIVIAVDGLDECIDLVDSGFVDALKALARSSPSIRVLVSSRSTPDSEDVPSILIDKSKTENDIRAYVAAKTKAQKIKAVWVVDQIVQKSEGRFRCE